MSVRDNLRSLYWSFGSLSDATASIAASARLQSRAAQDAFRHQLLQGERYRDQRHLARFEHQIYSQNGEDGILAAIFQRIGGEGKKSFIEFGVEDGLETNSTALLAQGWHGLWVEANARSVSAIKHTFASEIRCGRLKLLELFVTAENAAASIADDEPDLLSLDIDQNTYWLWKSLGGALKPRVIVVEYNASWGSSANWVMPYDAGGTWQNDMCFGASLKAYEALGESLGYKLVGCDTAGVNAFFVRSDLCQDKFLSPFDSETHFEPPRYWLIRTHGHKKGWPCCAPKGSEPPDRAA